jgi:hypothetical protein
MLMIASAHIASIWNGAVKTAAAQNLVAVGLIQKSMDVTVTWGLWFKNAGPWALVMTFVLFVVFLIVVQGFVSNAVRMRSPLRGRSPNAVVAIVAADVTALLNQNANADVDEYLKREYAQAQPNVDELLVIQDPREVATKFAKRIETFFFPIGEDLEAIVTDWVRYLREVKLFGDDDPVFPRTRVRPNRQMVFASDGVEPMFWSSAAPIRAIFKAAFTSAGLPYFTPHSFRSTLVVLGERICKTPEQFKAWSQNLGHESPLTTFTSYGRVALHRQGELIRGAGRQTPATTGWIGSNRS